MTDLAGGRYALADRVATGGMGEVWRALDTVLNREVAVKLLRSDIADDAAFRSRFATEAQNAAALHDPRIATVFDYGDDVDLATGRHSTYLVMELVDGAPLSDLLTSPIAPSKAAHLVAQAADGLAVAHEAGIVHRDVKPANFIVTRDGRVKVTDFGIARARGAASVTDTGAIMGTPHYVAPEVAEGREATPASDIYSLGIVLYECLSGVRPFTGDSPLAVAMAHLREDAAPLPASVPTPLRSLVEAALSKDPARRPPSAAAFASELWRATGPAADDAGAVPLVALPATATQVLPAGAALAAEAPPSRRRTPGWIPVLSAAAAVVVIAVLASALLGNSEDSSTVAEDKTTSPTSQRSQPPATTSRTTQPTTSQVRTTRPSASEAATSAPVGVRVDAGDYVGSAVKDAKAVLHGLGLNVSTKDATGGEKDIVADVRPSGMIADGGEVTLFVYDGKVDGGGDKQGGDKPRPPDDQRPNKPTHPDDQRPNKPTHPDDQRPSKPTRPDGPRPDKQRGAGKD